MDTELQDFIAMGKYLYGERWKSPASRALGVSYQLICKITKQQSPLQTYHYHNMIKLVAVHDKNRQWSKQAEMEIQQVQQR